MKKIILFVFLLFVKSSLILGQVQVPDYPDDAYIAADFKLWADGKEILVYDTPVAAMASFCLTDSVEIKIWSKVSFMQVDIRPKHLNIISKHEGNYLTFKIPKNIKISVELDKRIYRPLLIFGQEPINEAEKKDADYFYDAGKIHKIGRVVLKSNQKVFIEAGAIVEGAFHFYETENVKIIGHGIIDNRNLTRKTGTQGIKGVLSNNFEIKGIHIIGNPRWTSAYFACADFSIDDVRIIGWRPSDDGIDIVGSENSSIRNSFVRVKDDCIAVKAMGAGTYDLNEKDYSQTGCKNVKNLLVENNVIWNADWGNAIEIGFETRAEFMEDMIFRNNDIIHVEANGGVFTIHNGDRGMIRNILYENIRIEDARGYLCHFQILNSHYSKDKKRGQGKNIKLKNITVSEGIPLNSIITGYDDEHIYDGVYFENLIIHGEKISSPIEANVFSEYAKNIKFIE
ncbi:MAG: hypothetical protein JEY94_01445 [Melioribacteraceae bacterium]|nr:hypothetical protein [Melioribacteraceae bacterium]